MTYDQYVEVVKGLAFPEYTFHAGYNRQGEYELWATYMDVDIETGGDPVLQTTRKWVMPPESVPMQVVQTALKCVLTSREHFIREHMTWNKRLIFSPHQDLLTVWNNAKEIA